MVVELVFPPDYTASENTSQKAQKEASLGVCQTQPGDHRLGLRTENARGKERGHKM